MERDGFWLAFNGEVYNFKELRKELESSGIEFRTRSDTEVLLEGIRNLGWAFLDKVEGMWAIAAYREQTSELSLSRDRFGEKPLYFAQAADSIFFGSEVPLIAKLSGTRLRPDVEQLKRFLVNGYKSLYKHSGSFVENVREVPAGCTIHFDEVGQARCERYWVIKPDAVNPMDSSTAVGGVRERLIRSVELRLRADVPVAFSLSGGVDSVALASIARRVLETPVHGFTIMNSDPRYDEKTLVEIAVKELGIEHTAVQLNVANLLGDLPKMVKQRGAPVLTPSSYMQWLLMKRVSDDGFSVIAGGVGADEIFSGYYDHHLLYFASLDSAALPEAISAWQEALGEFVRNPLLQDPMRFVTQPDFRDHIYLDRARFESMLNEPFHDAFVEIPYGTDLLRLRMMNELFVETLPVLLHEEDLNAMAASLENRSPFLDRHLVEFAWSIPTPLLFSEGRAKAVLRAAVSGIAPDAVIDNPRKVGFNVPLSDLVNLHDAHTQRQILRDSPIFDLVNRSRVVPLLQAKGLSNSESKFLFAFLSAKAFLESLE